MTTPDPIDVWIVTHPDGHLGVFATEKLALEHAARFTDPRIAVEPDIVRTEPMAELDLVKGAAAAFSNAVDNLIANKSALAENGDPA